MSIARIIRRAGAPILALAVLAVLAGCDQGGSTGGSWPMGGGNLANTRQVAGDKAISVDNAGTLGPAWSINLKGTVGSVTPVSDGQALYLPTANGWLYKVDRQSGAVLWEIELAKLLEVEGAFSKANVFLTDKAVFFGIHNVPMAVAIDRQTGALLWKTKLDDHPMAKVSQAPLVHGGRVFIGVSGLGEEVAASFPDYKCCSFRGSVVALDEATGRLLWRTYTMPEGFAGGSVWSGMPSLDAKRNTLYIGTGNAFSATPDVQACADANKDDPAKLDACYPNGADYDSILALDPATGAIKWRHRAHDYDIFTGACLVMKETGAYDNCHGGPDWDFAQQPMQWKTATGKELVGAGQKSGIFWALDPDTGALAWKRWVGPGGPTGGIQYGATTDGRRVYVGLSNTKQIGHDAGEYTLKDGRTIRYGSYAALDAATGEIIWQVPDPAGEKYPGNDTFCTRQSPREDCTNAAPRSPLTLVNGVLLGCTGTPNGPMYAFDASTGRLLWSKENSAGCNSGASVLDGTVYWATGRALTAFKPGAKPAS